MSRDFLVEIGTEELPPTALKNLGQAFQNGIESGLEARDLGFSGCQWFATPRRLAVLVENLAEKAPDKDFEIHGPPLAAAKDKDGNWTKAAEGFAKKNGCSPDDLKVVTTEKGERLARVGIATGYTAVDSLEFIVSESLKQLPIPKRMRWGSSRDEFIRPVHWAVMLYGDKVIPAELFGITATHCTRGHRFHCNTELEITSPAKYTAILANHGHVIADFEQRRAMINEQVKHAAQKVNGKAIIDPDLLDEVTGLVEWPVALTGSFDEAFLSVPPEALISSMKEHQKYFHVVNDQGELLPHFITVANIDSHDPKQVIAGNERVIRPRLADAAFFFETDNGIPLADRVDQLKSVVFQQQLGTLYDKTERVQQLAETIAGELNEDTGQASRAAYLAKADLVSEMVLEFDKMQGIAGYYYAQHAGEPPAVAQAIKEQYLPRFAGDDLPQSNIACALALADRLDTLVGIFGIGQPPTGSKDPFALRRASLSVLRIMVEKQLPLDLRPLIEKAKSLHANLRAADTVIEDVLEYMIERFRAWYEEEGIPVQVFQAVSAKGITQPLDFDRRVQAVHSFSRLEEAEALASANKRVSNILAKYDGTVPATIDQALLQETAEQQLAKLLGQKQKQVEPLFNQGDYTAGLQELAELRGTVDEFFDHVMVMTDDEKLKQNRLAVLQQLRQLFLHVADISQLAATQ